MNGFLNSHLDYCPLTWMCQGRMANMINKLHERCLGIIYSSKSLSYEEMLEVDTSILLHQRNLCILDS